jgi:hypothetical protein
VTSWQPSPRSTTRLFMARSLPPSCSVRPAAARVGSWQRRPRGARLRTSSASSASSRSQRCRWRRPPTSSGRSRPRRRKDSVSRSLFLVLSRRVGRRSIRFGFSKPRTGR